MTVGLIFVSLSFVMSGLLQLKIEVYIVLVLVALVFKCAVL